MLQSRAPRTPGPRSTDRTWTLITRGGAVLLVVLLAAFGYLYWQDQRTPASPSMNERAISQAEAAVRKNPNSVESRLALASAYELDKRYDDALSQIDQILKVDAGNRLALLGRGYAYYLKGENPKAAQAYQKVIENSPKGEFSSVDTILQEARYYLGVVKVKDKDWPAARESLEAALTMSPTDADALYQLGLVELGTNNPQAAVTNFNKALAFVPNGWAEPWTELARAYQSLGDQPHVTYAKAMAAAASGRADEATGQLKTLVDTPVKLEAMTGLATIAQAEGRNDEAIAWFEKVLVADPGNAGATAAIATLKGGQGH